MLGLPFGSCAPLELRPTTVLELPDTPAGLMIVRSEALSPFKLESTPLCGVNNSGDS